MPNYTLELELFSSLNALAADFEIWADGARLGNAYTISADGTENGASYSDLVTLEGVTGLDLDLTIAADNLIV